MKGTIQNKFLSSRGHTKSGEQVQTKESLAFNTDQDANIHLLHSVLLHDDDNDNIPSVYHQNYEQLVDWIGKSLESYKLELHEILYPLFVHFYFNLISKGFSTEASRFLERFACHHQDRYASEMRNIAAIKTPTHLTENTLAVMWRTHKYCINMSTTVFQLLINFLQDNHLISIVAIINQFLSIKTHQRAHQNDSVFISGLVGAKDRQQLGNGDRMPPVQWGILEDCAEYQQTLELYRQSERTRKLASIDKQFEQANKMLDDAEAIRGTKKKVAAVNEAEHKLNAAQTARREIDTRLPVKIPGIELAPPQPFIPKPSSTNTQNLAALQDIRRRVVISDRSLPSIAMFTFLNAQDSINTIELTQDASMVAAGYNSFIKVWHLKRDCEKLFGVPSSSSSSSSSSSASSTLSNKANASSSSSAGQKSTQDDYTTLIGHSGAVFGLSFSPDSRFLLSGSEDNTVRLWSLESNNNLVAYTSHNYPVWDVDFSPVGCYFATASHDRTARLFSTERVYAQRIFIGHLADVDTVKFHPNCNYIATGSSDKTVRLWHVQTGECVRIFTGHSGMIHDLAFSVDGKTLASCSSDKTCALWDLASGRRIAEFHGHRKDVWSVDFSKGQSNLLASASADQTVRLWNVAKANQEFRSKGGAQTLRTSTKRKRKLPQSPHLIESFPTKSTPVYNIKFTNRNLLLATGVFTNLG